MPKYDYRPTFENQLAMARKVLENKGPYALYDPHVLTGRNCGCRDCFCCAAVVVWQKHYRENVLTDN
jgi:hypothetical protein